MKKNIKKLIKSAFALLLCTLMLFPVSCGDNREQYAVYGVDENGKLRAYMTEGMFSYFLSQQKTTYFTVLRYNDNTITADSPEIWQKTGPDGTTYEEAFFNDVLEEAADLITANTILYSLPATDGSSGNYTLTETYLDYVDALVAQYAQENYGSVMGFEEYLLNFGATLEDYTMLYIMTANIDLLKDGMFNDDTGLYKISEEEKQQYYVDNYYTVRHIFINTAYDEKIDGTRAPLSEAESRKRTETADEIFSFIESGKSYEDAAENFTQSYVVVYPGTSIMNINSGTANAPELGKALKTMEVGEVKQVKSDHGIHVIQRIATDPQSYNENEDTVNAIRSAIANQIYPEIIDANKEKVTINHEIVGNYSLATALLP